MLEARGNIFNVDCDALCVTTNGFIKKNGEVVMGRGCAKELANMNSRIPARLGNLIRTEGHKVHLIGKLRNKQLIAFPVKPTHIHCTSKGQIVRHMQDKFSLNDSVPGWACVADIKIIEQSAKELVELADKNNWQKVVLPRPGCGAGELSWFNVHKVLSEILDDRFICMTF